jgi:hypothetical protein
MNQLSMHLDSKKMIDAQTLVWHIAARTKKRGTMDK